MTSTTSQDKTANKRADVHPCPERDTNVWPQGSGCSAPYWRRGIRLCHWTKALWSIKWLWESLILRRWTSYTPAYRHSWSGIYIPDSVLTMCARIGWTGYFVGQTGHAATLCLQHCASFTSAADHKDQGHLHHIMVLHVPHCNSCWARQMMTHSVYAFRAR